MAVTFDPNKDTLNLRKHEISLVRASDFDFGASYTIVDDREDYGEVRYRAIGFLDGSLHVLVYTELEGGIRAISLRKAERMEESEYAENY